MQSIAAGRNRGKETHASIGAGGGGVRARAAGGAGARAGWRGGRQVFVSRCAGCHGSDGNGGELGPGIATRVPRRKATRSSSTLFRQGRARRGHAGDSASLTAAETGEPRAIPAHADAAQRLRPGPHHRHARRRPPARRSGPQSEQRRPPAARRRSQDPPAAKERRRVPRRSRRRPTGPVTTARRPAAATVRSRRSPRATSPRWRPSGSSACRTRRVCR